MELSRALWLQRRHRERSLRHHEKSLRAKAFMNIVYRPVFGVSRGSGKSILTNFAKAQHVHHMVRILPGGNSFKYAESFFPLRENIRVRLRLRHKIAMKPPAAKLP